MNNNYYTYRKDYRYERSQEEPDYNETEEDEQ